MSVAVDDLGGDGLHHEAEAAADVGLHLRGNGGMGAHGAADLAHGDRLLGLGQAVALAAQLVPPGGELEAEGGGLSVDAMGAAYADGLLVLQGLLADGVHEGPHVLLQQFRGLDELEGEAGVPDIVRGEADMDVARFGAEGVGEGAQEDGHVVVHLRQVAGDVVEVVAGLSELGQSVLGDDAALGPGVADGELHLEPLVQLALLGPDAAHLGPGVALDHGRGR